jgi:hypothetical protein
MALPQKLVGVLAGAALGYLLGLFGSWQGST